MQDLMIQLHQPYFYTREREEVKICSEQKNNSIGKTQTLHREKD